MMIVSRAKLLASCSSSNALIVVCIHAIFHDTVCTVCVRSLPEVI